MHFTVRKIDQNNLQKSTYFDQKDKAILGGLGEILEEQPKIEDFKNFPKHSEILL